ncbi:carbohydrate porin [Salipiger bermudensis]|uniref:carbohydrate porin n=1 Tax=Salipiger bermudensis TaxID=344736 RepID=UPI001C99C6A1|nr:carbohydrate porin [Salipiger bermudensis]MBY6006682.1 carbohydrate porin [Salipiger bermudensis]
MVTDRPSAMSVGGAAALAAITLAFPTLAQETDLQDNGSLQADNRGFAGPAATTSQLAEDAAPKDPAFRFPAFDRALTPWFDAKQRLQEQTGLQLGFDYATLYQYVDDPLQGQGDDYSSGIFKVFGRWDLVNRNGPNKGTLVFSFENRHAFTDISPADAGFANGYLGVPGTLFSDTEWVLGDLNWQQSFNGGRTGIIAGRYDPNDFFDTLGYANPRTAFSNLAILLNPSIALPDFSTGIGIGHWFNDSWYIKAAVNDANGTTTDPELFDDAFELYKTVEVGWSPSIEQRYFSNVHLTYWHVDEREETGTEESLGLSIGANWTFDDVFMPFIRAGWSEGAAPLYNESYTVGAVYRARHRADLMGAAVNWGQPSDESLDPQTTTEIFYRLQLAENLAITPSIQFIDNPALTPDRDSMAIFGLRTRFSF